MVCFQQKLRQRFESLILTSVSKKMMTGTAWSIVTTWLLTKGFVNEQTWSMVLLGLIGIIFGVAATERIAGVKYVYNEQPKPKPVGEGEGEGEG